MNKLITDRWRPSKIEDIILLDRVYDKVKNGLTKNTILYGHYGTGKTSLSRILIGKYKNTNPYIEINSSYYTSIDTLRNVIDDFCSKVQIDFNNTFSDDSVKYVFLDEFDRTSKQYQDALKAYIEEYSSKNVRFILCTNHIDKISDGIKSRFLKINFDPENKDEEVELKRKILIKIKNNIYPYENKGNSEFNKNNIIKIINSSFPDVRNILINVEDYIENGTISNSKVNINLSNDVINIIIDQNINFNDIYHFTYENFGNDGIKLLISIIIKSLIPKLISLNIKSDKLFNIIYITTDYETKIENSIDPIIVGVSLIGKIKEILKNE